MKSVWWGVQMGVEDRLSLVDRFVDNIWPVGVLEDVAEFLQLNIHPVSTEGTVGVSFVV